MKEVLIDLLAIAALIAVMVISLWVVLLVGFVVAQFRGKGRGPDERLEVRRARRNEPQFEVLEAYFRAPVPESLRHLYRDRELLDQEEFSLIDPDDLDPDTGHFVREFLPADQQALESIPRKLGKALFPFAADGSGGYYCVLIRGNALHADTVYFWHTWRSSNLERMQIAASLDEFIGRERHPARRGGADR